MKRTIKHFKPKFFTPIIIVMVLVVAILFVACNRATEINAQAEVPSNFEIVCENERVLSKNGYSFQMLVVCDKNTKQMFYVATYGEDMEIIPVTKEDTNQIMTKDDYKTMADKNNS